MVLTVAERTYTNYKVAGGLVQLDEQTKKENSTKVPIGKKHNSCVTYLLRFFFNDLMKEPTSKELCDKIPFIYDKSKTQKIS